MPLLKGEENIGKNIETEEKTHPKKQAVAIALHEAGVPRRGDNQPGLATAASSAMPAGGERRQSSVGSSSANDRWTGRTV